MSDIVKKGFFRRCLYRATGAYLLEQHIQMLEQQVKTQQMQLAQMEKEREERKAQDAQQQQFNTTSQERLDHLELHAAAQDEHRNNIDAQLQQTAGQTNDLQRRMEWAEDGMREAGLLPSELQLFNKKSYSQAGEDAILMYIFVMLGVPLSQCNYLDLGANHPCDMSNTWFFYQQGATGILVDANPKLAEELRRARPKDQVINACVGPVSGETLDFHVLSADGLSAPGDVSEVLRANPAVRVLETIPMQTVAVNDLMEQLGGAPKILNLDIEGMEMEILRSIDFAKYRPTTMIIEMIPYSKQLVAGKKNPEILRFMQEKGYVEYAFTGINSIFLDKQLYEKITGVSLEGERSIAAMSVNVEEIMSGIRAEIQEKGYSSDMLSFADVPADADAGIYVERFDADMLRGNVQYISEHHRVDPYRPLAGNPVAVFFKKVLRKFMSFYVEPYAAEQSSLNANIAQAEQQVELYIRESRMHSTKELLDKVEALELQQKNTKIAMEQMQAQIAALQAKLNGEDAR